MCACAFAARSTSADAAAKIGLPCDERGEINAIGDGGCNPVPSTLRFRSTSPLCFVDQPDRFGEDADARTPIPEYECLGVPPPEDNVPDENAEPAVPPSIASGDDGEEECAEDALRHPLPSEPAPIDRGVELAEPEPETPNRRNSVSPLECPLLPVLSVAAAAATLPNATGSPPDPPPVLGSS